MRGRKATRFRKELRELLNSNYQPDDAETDILLLVEYLVGCLELWDGFPSEWRKTSNEQN